MSRTSSSLVPGPGLFPGRTIVACLLALLALAPAVASQEKRKRGGKHPGGGGRAALVAKRKAEHGKRDEPAPPPAAGKPGAVSQLPPMLPEAAPTPEEIAATAEAWKGLTEDLTAEYFARHPDAAWRAAWPHAKELGLGAFGDEGGMRWRRALLRARAALARLDPRIANWEQRGAVAVLGDWIEAELLALDTQALPTHDPASHVQQALRTLQAASEAAWLPASERDERVATLLAGLPAYLDEARLGLLGCAPPWIDLALKDLDDLEALVIALTPRPPEKPPKSLTEKPQASPAPLAGGKRSKAPDAPRDPRRAVEGFRGWLVGIRATAGGDPPAMEAPEWARFVRLASGTALEPGEIKTACLRDLARLELPSTRRDSGPDRTRATKRLALRSARASGRAYALGRQAQLLPLKVGARSVTFTSEQSPRSGLDLVSLRPGGEGLRCFLELAPPSWPAERGAARSRELGVLQLAALGVRHGLAGEGLLELARHTSDDPLADLPVARALSEGMGLYAQDWLVRVDWVEENTFAANERLKREFDLERGLEAARLLAALEIHAEGFSLEEAAASFRRRTGASEDVAAAEALAAQRDPLRGVGYLGLLELQGLEQRFTALTGARKGLRLVLSLVFHHPSLRPCDLAAAPLDALNTEH